MAERATSIIRGQPWSRPNVPLLWAAAGHEDEHPIVEWLARAAQVEPVTVAAIHTGALSGATAVREA